MENIEIETLQDIIDKVPEESIENFLKDIWKWYIITKQIKLLSENFGAGIIEYDTWKMLWKDDDKNEVNIIGTIKSIKH